MLTETTKNLSSSADITSTPKHSARKILVLFGTRPEAIKLAPVIHELERNPAFQPIIVSSSQHTNLLAPFLRIFDI